MKPTLITLSGLLAMASMSSFAAEVDVKITNLTQGIYFTPILVGAHNDTSHLFQSGTMASTQLQAMAEGGDISGLVTVLDSISANHVANPAGGLLAPGGSTMTSMTPSDGNTKLSITAMMLPTNDGFVGLDSWSIPSQAGTYTIYLNAYDAGTEANNELVIDGSGAPGVAGIPASPGGAGMGGMGVTNDEANTYIHIHRGNLGDDQMDGGASDLDNTVHRWLNPVAKVTVTVK